MGNVAADGDGQAMQAALGTADRQRVQQCLRRVFMPPVARIEHGAVHLLRQQIDGTGLWMADHQQIGVHGVQRHCRINQGFAFFDRGRLHRHIHHIRPQPLARDLEARLRPGGVFEEHIDLCQPA